EPCAGNARRGAKRSTFATASLVRSERKARSIRRRAIVALPPVSTEPTGRQRRRRSNQPDQDFDGCRWVRDSTQLRPGRKSIRASWCGETAKRRRTPEHTRKEKEQR